MSIKISDQQMANDQTPHSAKTTADGWTVTWLPGRTLTRNQATTTMVLAEVAWAWRARARPAGPDAAGQDPDHVADLRLSSHGGPVGRAARRSGPRLNRTGPGSVLPGEAAGAGGPCRMRENRSYRSVIANQ